MRETTNTKVIQKIDAVWDRVRMDAEAITRPDAPAAAFREHGIALRARGERAPAAQALRRYLELSPDADDAAFIQMYLAELEASP